MYNIRLVKPVELYRSSQRTRRFVFFLALFLVSVLLVGCNEDNGVVTPQIRIHAVSPNQIAAGKTNVEVQITGSGFTSVSAVSAGEGVSVFSFHAADPSRIVVRLDVDSKASPGPRTISVTTPTATGQLPGGLEVVQNRQPKISFTVEPPSGNQDTLFTFDARGSSDPDGKIKGYHWDFGDGNESTKAVAKYRFAKSGTQTVTLTLTDDAGFESSKSKSIRVVFDAQVARKQIDAVCKEFLRLYSQIETLSAEEIVVGFSTRTGCPGRRKEIDIINRNKASGGSVDVNIYQDTVVSRVDESSADAFLPARFSGRHSDGSFFDGIVTHTFQMRNEEEGWKICDFKVD